MRRAVWPFDECLDASPGHAWAQRIAKGVGFSARKHDADRCAIRDADGQTECSANRNAGSDGHTSRGANRDADADCNTGPNCNTGANCNTDGDCHTPCGADRDAYAHADCDAHAVILTGNPQRSRSRFVVCASNNRARDEFHGRGHGLRAGLRRHRNRYLDYGQRRSVHGYRPGSRHMHGDGGDGHQYRRPYGDATHHRDDIEHRREHRGAQAMIRAQSAISPSLSVTDNVRRSMRLLRLRASGACLSLAITLSACSGGGNAPFTSTAVATSGSPVASDARDVATSFTFTIPRSSAHAAANRRDPLYLPLTTMSLAVALVTVGGVAPSPTPSPTIVNVSGCASTSGDYTCTVAVGLPIGTDVVLVKSFDAAGGSGNVLSQQNGTFTVVAASANNFTMTLDAKPGAIVVSGAGCSGSPLTCTTSGTSALSLTLTVADAHGTALATNTIPGSPVISVVSSNTAIATVTAAQTPYGITVTPVAIGTATIAVTAHPASGTSGLTATTLYFNFVVAPQLSGPAGVAVDGAGNIYVANTSANNVKIFTSAGVASSIAGGIITGLSGPWGVAVDGAGNIYVANRTANNVKIFTSTGAVSPIAGGTISGLNTPYGVAVDGAGNIYVANFGGHNVKIFTNTGAPSPIAGGTITTGLNSPGGVTVDSAGNIYVADSYAYVIKIYTNSTTAGGVLSTTIGVGATGTIPTSAGLSDPIGLAVDSAGKIYVGNYGGNFYNVNIFSSTGVLLNTITAGVQNPGGVGVASGVLVVGNLGNNTVGIYNAATGALTNTIH